MKKKKKHGNHGMAIKKKTAYGSSSSVDSIFERKQLLMPM